MLNADESWALKNSVTGSGSVVKNGNGSVTLDEAAQWTGDTDINAGGVILGSADKAMMLASQQVNVQKDGHLSGFGGVAGNIDNKGTLLAGDSNRPAASPLTFTIGGNLINSGNVWTGSSGSVAGNQLVVNGNFQGNGGHLHLNTVLNDDNSVTDSLSLKVIPPAPPASASPTPVVRERRR